MPRPKKCRKVCHLPHEKEFIPANGCNGRPFIVMTVDEYETIRLIDKEGFSQEEELLVSWSPSRLHAHRGRTHQVKEVESLPACLSLGSAPK